MVGVFKAMKYPNEIRDNKQRSVRKNANEVQKHDIPLRPSGILFYVLRISSEWGLLGRNTRSAIRGTSSHPNLGEEFDSARK